jgi:lipopolysaccharide transport system ATP-binding protein
MKPLEPGIYTALCKVPGRLFNEGMYKVGLAVTEYRKTSLRVHFFVQDHLTFTVIDSVFDNPLRYGYGGPIPGVLRPYLEWTIEKTDKVQP